MKILFYLHGGSHNHGCEAIVRTTKNILEKHISDIDIVVYSMLPHMDKKYIGNSEKLQFVKTGEQLVANSYAKWILGRLQERVFHKAIGIKKKYRNLLSDCGKGDVIFSIGGDNYSENSAVEYSALDMRLRKKCRRQILWGCSLDPNRLESKNDVKINSLKEISLIVARESITYEGLVNRGFTNVKKYPDPAFVLEGDKSIKSPFRENETVGINISPLVEKFEKGAYSSVENFVELVKFILEKTNYDIAFIPHVVYPKENSDYVMAEKLIKMCPKSERIFLIQDQDCCKLKAHISRCRFFVCGRTHASIAAYSTCVPTLVMGYSVKAKGIAKDIFGTYENYVLPVQNLKNRNQLKESFIWLMNNEQKIRNQLEEIIPVIKEEAWKAGGEIKRLLDEKN